MTFCGTTNQSPLSTVAGQQQERVKESSRRLSGSILPCLSDMHVRRPFCNRNWACFPGASTEWAVTT